MHGFLYYDPVDERMKVSHTPNRTWKIGVELLIHQ
jgi:hypothetical protein